MTAIAIEGLTLGYPNGRIAVRELSLSISHGEIFGLLGLNGAGKSSLIKAIATLLQPHCGTIRVLGMDTRQQAPEIKRRIGVVPQENNLDTRLDIRQNLLFHCRYAGMPERLAVTRVEHWLQRLNLQGHTEESVFRLSGGTKRKIMLAKAFLTTPDLLILDEPSAGLDPGVRDVLWEQIRQFRRSGGAVFLSTHYLEEAEALCDRIGVLHQGSLAGVTRPADGLCLDSGLEVAQFFRQAVEPAPCVSP